MAQPEPLAAFFGAYKPTEAEMRATLEDAAEEIERLLPKLFEQHTTGSQIKAAQLALILREVRAQQHAMWGDLGLSMREGMERAALAAVQGESIIDRYLARNGLDMPELRASFRAQARRGFRNMLAKGFNGISLNRQVYKTEALANGWIDKQIRRALILQTSAKDLAKQLKQFIDPNVKGGVSFAAFRVARTELNNAFHTVAKERADEPWARGVGWHLSGSHPPSPPGKPEVCERYARVDHGLGVGIWLPKDVPRKPHPQCLCYITQEVVSEDEFIDKLLAGDYDEYLGHRAEEDPPKDDPAKEWLKDSARDRFVTNKELTDQLVKRYGVSRTDAKAMVDEVRPPKGKPAAKPKGKPVVVPLRPDERPPANTATKGTPTQGQATGPIKPAKKVPTSTPATPAPPSQVPQDTLDHIDKINKFSGTRREKVTRGLRHQAKFTPRLMKQLREVGESKGPLGQDDSGTLAEYNRFKKNITVFPLAFSSAFEANGRKYVRSGWFSECGQSFSSFDQLIAHEYGHHVHSPWLIAGKDQDRARAEVMNRIAQLLGVPPSTGMTLFELNNWVKRNEGIISRMVSRYGATDAPELLAEIWAEYTTGEPPRFHIREIGEIMQRLAEENS